MKITKTDPLYSYSEREKEIVWKNREFFRDQAHYLPKLLLSVKWTKR